MTATLPNPKSGTPHPGPLPIAAQRGEGGALVWTEHPLVDTCEGLRRLSDAEAAALVQARGGAALEAYVAAREERLRLAKVDPLRFGFDLPHWPMLWHYLLLYWELFNFGGNDSAKTTFMGKTVNKILNGELVIPGAMEGAPQVCCIAQNETMSKRVQQRKVFEFLPAVLRKYNDSAQPKKRSAVQKISYSDDGGFTNGTFSLAQPRGAAVIFRNVTQFERNELALEGDGFHLIPVDESCPLALLDVLRFRAAKKRGRIPYCFTPVKGFDSVCANVLRGARVIAYLPMQWDWTTDVASSNRCIVKSENGDCVYRFNSVTIHGSRRSDGQFIPKGAEAIAEFLTGGINPQIEFPELRFDKEYVKGVPPGHMPVVMKPLNPKAIVVFSWSHWNPFAPRSDFNRHLPAIADRCVGRGERMALMRLFGYTEEIAGAILNNFRAEYYPKGHLIRHEELLEMARTTKHNLRHGADPATRRSWFMGWKLVFPNGADDRPMQYLGWESPTREEGEWVTPDGEKGDGQRRFPGADVNFYKAYIREREAAIAREIYGDNVPKGYIGSPENRFQPDILRAGDAKGFASPSLGTPESNLFELFFRDDSSKDPRCGPMIFRPAKVRATVVDDVGGEGKLIDLLACDWNKPIDATNHPHLLVSDRCVNTIFSWLNWDGKKQNMDGKVENSPHADPVDMARVLFDLEVEYQETTPGTGNASGGAWT